jgi:hypothetical protein
MDAAPSDLVRTRLALHAIAERVISPARVLATGYEIALEATPGGFGTPPLPDGGRVRVEGSEIVVEDGAGVRQRAPITTLRAAGRLSRLDADLPDEPLSVDPDAAAFLGAFYAFATCALERLRVTVAESSPVRLWPEHFDVAIDAGKEAAGLRATYGASPGDEQHAEPYLYVAPWKAPPRSPSWNGKGFAGAELGWSELISAPDPMAAALRFWTAPR